MKIFANKKFKRFIIILMVVIMTFNIVAPQPIVPQAEAASIGGILMSPLTALAGGLAWAFQQVLNGVTYIAVSLGTGEAADTTDAGDVFISDIIYNELVITNANIFNPDNKNPLLQTGNAENGGITGVVKQWYGITRMMAIAASLVILVYVAIKIILASTGKDKAKYTELLKDWLLSLLLIFTLHYVMAAVLFISDSIVSFFALSGEAFSYKSIQDQVFQFNDFSIVYALVWIALLIYTFVFLVLYIKRLILICFFVVISPLVVILSTINKLRGKGSGVLDTWLKEFIANVVMQPIDALLFTIVISSINICINSNPSQPLIALAFVIAFFPLRSWVTQFFGQDTKMNSQEGAAKFAAAGANMFSSKLQGAANSPKKPKFNTSNMMNAVKGIGGRGAGGAVGNGSSEGGSSGEGEYNPSMGYGAYAATSPRVLDAAKDTIMNGKVSEPGSLAATHGVVGNTSRTVGGVVPGPLLESSGNSTQGRLKNGTKSAAGILGRATKLGLQKGTGAFMGATVGGLNAIAGSGFWKNYTPTSNATQKLTGRTIDNTAKKASDYYESAANGGLQGIAEQFTEDAKSVKNSVVGYVEDSYIVTGEEGISDDKEALGKFFADGEVDDMIHELIEECGAGDPLYDAFKNTSSVSAKRDIAQQFFIQSAIKDYGGADRFTDLVKRRKNSELKATLSVMQRHKGALTGKDAQKAKEKVKQRSVNYNNSNSDK